MAGSPQLKRLRVAVFEGAWNLPLWAGQHLCMFEERGLTVELLAVPNSLSLINALYAGEVDIAMAAADNFIAYQECDGEVRIDRSDDLRIVMGGDGGFLALVGAPGMSGIDDVRGRRLGVDALTTGFAFVLLEMLRHHGIARDEVTIIGAGGTISRYQKLLAGEFEATLLRTPFEVLALRQGCHHLCGTGFLGPYQGTVGAVRSRWAEANGATLVAFLRSYRQALQWCHRPESTALVRAILNSNLPETDGLASQEVARRLLHPQDGLRLDMDVSIAGLQAVLTLRDRFGASQQALKSPGHYVDDRYRLQALAV